MYVIISDESEIWSTPIESTFILHFKKARNLLYQLTINLICSLCLNDLNDFLLVARILLIVYFSHVIMNYDAVANRWTKLIL